MNKKFLSLFLCGALVSGSAGMFVSCKNYDSDIASLDDRITAVEKSVSELKAQISAGAVITDVTPTENGVKVTLSNGKTFELTNGKDGANGTNGSNGADGQDGKPGSVVTIGDNGNWFIDGVDTWDWMETSSAETGSSAMMSCGCTASALAMPIR